MKLKAIIISIRGTKLSNKEKKLLNKEKPWGIILFKRNLKSITQIKHLTASIKKYTKNKSFHFLPARISKSQYKFLMKISKEIFIVCNCKGIARIDYIMSPKNGKIFFLEMNTHPGLTKLSLAPEQANYRGLSYLDLLKQIINSAL